MAQVPPAAAPVVETPVVEAAVVETPVVETPVVAAPAVETPLVEAPVVEAEAPVVATPVVETLAVETPLVEAPVVEAEAPVVATPVVETPVVATPVVETPSVEVSVVETPAVAAALPVTEPQPLPEPNATVASPVAAEAASENPKPAEPSSSGRDPTTGTVPLKFAGEASTSDDRRLDTATERPAEANMQLASLGPADAGTESPTAADRPAKSTEECFAIESCVDDYLWSLYEKTPKVDTNKVVERVKKTVKQKGKIRTVMTTITKYVVGDFTWKDPAAAARVRMPLKQYVIGGMERGFKLKLYRALRAMEAAGFMPGITSAFRDDYRQAIASGNKAASDSSYHGGSRRGGYGHGLAADIVSVKGETRLERYASSDALWKWIDANEKKLGIGRPYRDRDPPHVGPIDGREFAVKRALAKVRLAKSQTKKVKTTIVEIKKHPLLNRVNPDAIKRGPEKSSSKVSSLQARTTVQR